MRNFFHLKRKAKIRLPNSFNLDLPRIGYFLLPKSQGGWFSNIIERRQRQEGFSEEDSKYTHVEVLLGGPNSVRVAPPKTKIIDITKQYKGRYVKIVKYNADDYDRKRYKVALWAASFNNLPYDKAGVLAFLGWFRKWLKHAKDLYFCSEMCLTSLQ
jgi:hypothetical protein